MLRNYIITALRNLVRNRLYAAINIVGLAIGFAAALLIVLFVRDELSYDTWIPQHERTYLVTQTNQTPGRAPTLVEGAYPNLAEALKLDFPAIEAVARVVPGGTSFFRHGNVEAEERVFWADPDFFSVVALPAVAGDLKTALARPESVVLTRRLARKYFGSDDPVGQTIELNRQHPMLVVGHVPSDNPPLQITAVIEDLPSNTHLLAEVFLSGRSQVGGIRWVDDMEFNPSFAPNTVQTYVRLKPGASPREIEQGLAAFVERHLPAEILGAKRDLTLGLLPIAKSHTTRSVGNAKKPAADLAILYAVSTIGFLVIAIASINFVNLMTARATRRAIEVGVRKTSGAERRDLIVQFLSESVIYAALSMVLGMALAGILLPPVDAFLGRTITLDFWRDGWLTAIIVMLALAVGILAGTYPAFVLSGFRPAATLKAASFQSGGSGALRQALVLLQFAVLVSFALITIAIWKQSEFATTQALRMDTDQVLLLDANCDENQLDQFKSLLGVRAAACSAGISRSYDYNSVDISLKDGSISSFPSSGHVGPGWFELLGLKPVAGRFFIADRDADLPTDPSAHLSASIPIVINEAAVRSLGFGSAGAAVGQSIAWGHRATMHDAAVPMISEIVGVVDDFDMDSINHLQRPTFFFIDPYRFNTVNLKLSGQDIPETLKAIDRLWDKNPRATGPASRHFLSQLVQDYYRDLGRQAQMFAVCAGIALFISCLGLFGLAAFTAETRTKEIGIRKAMGASRADLIRLILWQFTKPVLWANVIAWPAAYYVTKHWLEGFAHHIDLAPWMFIGASALAVLIAVATVVGHALLVARAKPVTALRYE